MGRRKGKEWGISPPHVLYYSFEGAEKTRREGAASVLSFHFYAFVGGWVASPERGITSPPIKFVGSCCLLFGDCREFMDIPPDGILTCFQFKLADAYMLALAIR